MICVVACLAGQSEVLPDLLAFCAWLEGTHTVQVARKAGKINLVLGHQPTGAVNGEAFLPRALTARGHRHGLASKVLCILANRASSPRDHEILFSGGLLGEASERRSPAPKAAPTSMAAGPVPVAVLPAESLRLSRVVTGRHRTPPGALAVLRSLRSTSLLL